MVNGIPKGKQQKEMKDNNSSKELGVVVNLLAEVIDIGLLVT